MHGWSIPVIGITSAVGCDVQQDFCRSVFFSDSRELGVFAHEIRSFSAKQQIARYLILPFLHLQSDEAHCSTAILSTFTEDPTSGFKLVEKIDVQIWKIYYSVLLIICFLMTNYIYSLQIFFSALHVTYQPWFYLLIVRPTVFPSIGISAPVCYRRLFDHSESAM